MCVLIRPSLLEPLRLTDKKIRCRDYSLECEVDYQVSVHGQNISLNKKADWREDGRRISLSLEDFFCSTKSENWGQLIQQKIHLNMQTRSSLWKPREACWATSAWIGKGSTNEPSPEWNKFNRWEYNIKFLPVSSVSVYNINTVSWSFQKMMATVLEIRMMLENMG